MLRQAIRQTQRRSLMVAVDPVLLLGDVLFCVALINPPELTCQPALPRLSR
jgi:hypothetical protein